MRTAEIAALGLFCVTLAACTLPSSRAPVAERSTVDSAWSTYRVRPGDTLVREGQMIKAGEALADIKGEGSRALLYFEIRRDGDPVDPAEVIPDR